jgi:hypothetical protein
MTNAIVQVNVSQTIAATPSKLQRTGAMISLGATTLTPGTYGLLTQKADLTGILVAPQTISSITWTSSVVTVTTAVPHGYPVGSQISLTIAGAAPTGYNGTFLATIASTTTFTYPLVSNPGTMTTPGTVVVANVTQLSAMVNTFYAQPGQIGVYVLELGVLSGANANTALDTWITNNQSMFYSYLVAREMAQDGSYPTFLSSYNAPTKKVYFFSTVTLSTYASITSSGLNKCAPCLIEAPGIPSSEFSMAAPFWVTLNANPSSTNRVPPLCFSFLFGVTPYPVSTTLAATLKAANVWIVSSGAEGGISDLILLWGNMPDGNPWNYWYSADWTQINLDLNISNTIINGSNTTINPLYYNQDGINRLQASAAQTMQQAISYGLALGQLVQTELDPQTFADNINAGLYGGQVVVNAVPFATWNKANPSTYSEGIYGGLAALYTPLRGFEQILFNLNVSNLAA